MDPTGRQQKPMQRLLEDICSPLTVNPRAHGLEMSFHSPSINIQQIILLGRQANGVSITIGQEASEKMELGDGQMATLLTHLFPVYI